VPNLIDVRRHETSPFERQSKGRNGAKASLFTLLSGHKHRLALLDESAQSSDALPTMYTSGDGVDKKKGEEIK
jgi:hypothetical protein